MAIRYLVRCGGSWSAPSIAQYDVMRDTPYYMWYLPVSGGPERKFKTKDRQGIPRNDMWFLDAFDDAKALYVTLHIKHLIHVRKHLLEVQADTVFAAELTRANVEDGGSY